MIGPPIAGAVSDWSGRSDVCLYLAGMFLISGSALSFVVQLMKRYKKTGKKEKKTEI
jgi:MFS family permease